MTQMPSASFGPGNQGLQVGQSYAPINAEFHLPPERPETPPQPFATIPFSRDPDFVNRGDILDQIDKRCSEPAARVALVGLGGVGKSQLAIEFAHRIAAGQPGTWVFWVHAGTQARVEEGFRTIADTVKLPGRNRPKANIPQLVYGWLSNERNGRWIMVLDSADDRDVFYDLASGDARDARQFATYLPQSRNGSILVTTRNKDLAFRLTGRRQNIIEVGRMAPTDALTLLEKKLGPLPDIDIATNLVQELDYIPLAISQAAAYIQARAPLSSPKKYLAEFRESERKKSRLLQHDAGDLRRDGGASNAILTTWQISFDHIRSKRPSAADLLSLMSFFDRQGIPGWVLKPPGITRRIRAKDPDEGEDEGGDEESDHGSSAVDSDVNDDIDDDMDGEFQDDLAMLRDYCLIVIDEAGNDFEMHGLVQLATRRWLEVFGKQEGFKQQYIDRLSTSFPTGDYENWALCRSLFAHVEVALGYRPSENTAERWAKLLHNGGVYAWSQGRYEVAQQMVGKARRVREKRLGKEDEATLNSMSLFSMVLSDRGRWEEAEKLLVQVMEISKTKLGTDHPDTLTSMGNLASTFWNQGRWEEASQLFMQVMETRKTKLGADHPDTLTSMGNLASTFWNQGRWEEAEKLEVQVMETRKTKLGADHPDTLTSMGNLASTYRNRGRWEEAEKLEVQVMETRKTKLGADHPSTLTSMGNLAWTYGTQGRWEEAEKLFMQVMETRKTKLGAEHPDTLTSMNNLAFTWKIQGRYSDALALMEECAQARQRLLGAEHPDTLSSLAAVAEWSN
ncbi:kinesin light chain [Cladorrhinum sp. PSN259]|nr:kinesin light chain [Cladorrhinum sp. PSN259]